VKAPSPEALPICGPGEARRGRLKIEARPDESRKVVKSQIPDSPDMVAWNRARFRRSVELALAITAGIAFTAMFAIFYRILTS
jgi:hypothetical protein